MPKLCRGMPMLYRHFQTILKPDRGYMNDCGRMRATWLSVGSPASSYQFRELGEALEKDLNLPPERDISPPSLFENVQLRLIHTVFL